MDIVVESNASYLYYYIKMFNDTYIAVDILMSA